jgi:carbamoyl-phosphate synthase large subunit
VSKPLTVLVLGVGGNVSQGILKALAHADLPCRLVAGCISPLGVGLYEADRSYVTPRADDPEFQAWLTRVCVDEAVDAVLSGSEPVLEALARQGEDVRAETGALCVVSPPDVLAVGRDKLLTARWLEQHGLAFPRSADLDDEAALRTLVTGSGFPLVAKPRGGKGAAGVVTITDENELASLERGTGLVVQEHLEGEEFTVGCLSDSDGRVAGAVAMRRELMQGTTYRAEAGEFPDVRAEAVAIAGALGPTGPLNVQLRVRNGRPVAFDLNVRFSGTTPARARLGFNEVEAALRHFVLGEPIESADVTEGTVLRYWNEVYVPAEAHEELARSSRLDDPRAHPSIVEDWGMKH